MSRQGAWRRAWINFIGSLYGESIRHKKYMGVDQFGNRFYEYEYTRLNVKRGFDPPENAKKFEKPPPEWKAWLNMLRKVPPTKEEILINQQQHQAQLQREYKQDVETERRAPKVDSTGRGVGETDGFTNFPYYKDIEIGPGVKKPSSHYDIEYDREWKLKK